MTKNDKKPIPAWLCIFSDSSATSRGGLKIRVARLSEEKIMRAAMEEMTSEERAVFVKLDEPAMIDMAAEKQSGGNRIFLVFESEKDEEKFLRAAMTLGVWHEAKHLLRQ